MRSDWVRLASNSCSLVAATWVPTFLIPADTSRWCWSKRWRLWPLAKLTIARESEITQITEEHDRTEPHQRLTRFDLAQGAVTNDPSGSESGPFSRPSGRSAPWAASASERRWRRRSHCRWPERVPPWGIRPLRPKAGLCGQRGWFRG